MLETKSKDVVQKSGNLTEQKELKALCDGHCDMPFLISSFGMKDTSIHLLGELRIDRPQLSLL